jgi:hypothetical protein
VPSILLRRFALAALVACAAAARAQDAVPAAIEDPRAAKFKDVERGLFTGFEVGYLSFLKTPAADADLFPYAGDGGRSQGISVAVSVGYDLGTRLSLSLFGLGTSQSAKASYGAFDVLAAGLDLRWAFAGAKDRNGWERFQAYAHARGGYLMTHPSGLFGRRDILVGGGLGAEYFTQLRHFSVGLQLDGLYALKAKAPGAALAPFIRYTF